MRSLPLRASLCATLNALHTKTSTTATLQSEAAIHSALVALPHWTDPRALLSSSLLSLQLHQFLLLLHTPTTLYPPTPYRPSPSHTYAATTVLSAAETIIALHTTLVNSGIFALTLLRLDYLRAALLTTHIAYHTPHPSFTSRLARTVVDATAGPALRLLEERSMRPGRGSHHYWYLSAAVGLVSLRYASAEGASDGEKERLRVLAGERVCALLYRVLALKEEGEGMPGVVLLGDGEAGEEAAMVTGLEIGDSAGGGSGFQGVGAVEGWDVETWGRDDFWFLGDWEDGVGMGYG